MYSRAIQSCEVLSLLVASWVKSFLKATPKICLPVSSGPKKTQPCSSCEKMRFHHFLQLSTAAGHLWAQSAAAGAAWCITVSQQVSSVLQISISFLLLFKLQPVSWVEPVFWMPSHFLSTSANSTKSVKGLSTHLWKNPGLTSSSWLSLCQRYIYLCFPLVFKAALQCVLLHLMGNFKRLHRAMLFLTLTPQL